MPKDPRSEQQVYGSPARMKANYTGGRSKDESTLSRKPSQVRVRLRRAAKKLNAPLDQIHRDMQMLPGYRPVEEWDVEELARGRPRNPKGGFQGPVPMWCTPIVTREAKKRLLNETFGKMAGHVDLAIKTLVKIMESEDLDEKGRPIVDARTQLAASTFVLEHILGKPTAVVEIGAQDETQRMLAMAIILEDGTPQDEPIVLDGEATWDDELEDDDDSSDSE